MIYPAHFVFVVDSVWISQPWLRCVWLSAIVCYVSSSENPLRKLILNFKFTCNFQSEKCCVSNAMWQMVACKMFTSLHFIVLLRTHTHTHIDTHPHCVINNSIELGICPHFVSVEFAPFTRLSLYVRMTDETKMEKKRCEFATKLMCSSGTVFFSFNS